MKNMLKEIDSRLNYAEEQITDLETLIVKIIQPEQHKEKNIKQLIPLSDTHLSHDLGENLFEHFCYLLFFSLSDYNITHPDAFVKYFFKL